MNTFQITTSISVFFILVISCIVMRIKLSDKFKIDATDILIGLAPILLWLLLSGKITKLEYAGVKIETAFEKAQKVSIKKEVLPLPIDNISTTLKAGIRQIDNIVSQQKEAVVFLVGYAEYDGEAIKEYLKKLLNTHVKYFVFLKEEDKSFIGLIPFNDLYIAFRGSEPVASEDDIAIWLKNGDIQKILKIPGMIPLDYALKENTSKEDALKKLLSFKLNILPVIDESGKFHGIVTDGRLSASILLGISEQLSSEDK